MEHKPEKTALKLDLSPSFWAGLLLTPLFHILFIVVSLFFFREEYSFLIPVLFLGAFQVLYMGPLIWWAWKSKRIPLAQGFAIASGLTLLLQGSCWVFVR